MKRPASAVLIFLSIGVAYLIQVLPWSGPWLLARPDFMLLVLLFWVIHEPRNVGQGMAFTLGLFVDVADSTLLGQHAMGYVIAVFAAQVIRVRIMQFPLGEQALHVLVLTYLSSTVFLLLNLALGADFPGLLFFVSPLLTAMLWAPATWLLYSPAVRGGRRESPT
jgi:rod shape-determining protein MreD